MTLHDRWWTIVAQHSEQPPIGVRRRLEILSLILTVYWQVLPMEWREGDFWISDDIKHFSIREVVRLHHQVYGIDAYSEEVVRRLLDTSFWLGVYKEKELIGLVRASTDKATFSYICDFIIDSKFQKRGLGSWMMKCFLEHPDILPTHIGLGTQSADSFFEKFDFERVSTMRRLARPE